MLVEQFDEIAELDGLTRNVLLVAVHEIVEELEVVDENHIAPASHSQLPMYASAVQNLVFDLAINIQAIIKIFLRKLMRVESKERTDLL